MFQFFKFIGDVIEYIIYYFFTLVESVINFFGHLFKGISFLITTVGFLPPFCRGALLAIIGISLIALLISSFIDFG